MGKKGIKDDVRIIRLAFFAVVASLGGWAVFQGVTDLLGLENLNSFVLIFLGFGITWGLYYLGFSKYLKK